MIAGLRWFGPQYLLPVSEVRVQDVIFAGVGIADSWPGPLVVLAASNNSRELTHLSMDEQQARHLYENLGKALAVIRERKAERRVQRES